MAKTINETVKTKNLPRVLVIVGPTSSGKTALSLKAARLHQGEIINADARQIYKGCSIGTGKPPGRKGKYQGFNAYFVKAPHMHELEEQDEKELKEVEIPHYLMDFLLPTEIMSVSEWREKAYTAIKGIAHRGHLPIVVGGTGLYLDALVENFSIPKVPPNPNMRMSYEKQPLKKLVDLLLKMDPSAGVSVDLKNQRRVIRALEIITFTGQPINKLRTKKPPIIEAFKIGIKRSREEIKRRIDESIDRMMEEGWPEEVRKLHKSGLPWDAPAMTSIGYKQIASYLRGEIMLNEAVKLAKIATHQYAKRQETWFKRDPKIHWVKDDEQGLELIKQWMD
ncbi:MAG: tRNA (adenosine(37)-N6)-dimethylallyltransferase MiaA [Patescibacteria group bacterium]|jgi:tRNA dimethylallyltransferase